MTTRSPRPRVQRYGNAAPPPLGPSTDAHQSMRNASMIAGVGILLIAALAGFANFVVLEGLVTSGDAARTAKHITESENLFRFGIVSMFVVVALDVVVAWALYHVFRPVSDGVSMLAAWFRLAYAAVFAIAIGQLPGVLRLLSKDHYLAGFSTEQMQAQALSGIDAFRDLWHVGLVLFGLHLLGLSYLAYRSGFAPKLLGVLLAVAGAGYVFDSVAEVLSRGSWPEVSAFTFVGEFLLALWLVIWGRRLWSSERIRAADPLLVAR
jgi:hypothetical protein